MIAFVAFYPASGAFASLTQAELMDAAAVSGRPRGRRLGPLAVGMAAQAFGLSWALAGLAVVPVLVLAGSVAQQRRAAKL
jgi:hypothetical protein